MKDNYPLMTSSQEAIAPWNQEENKPIQVDCSVCYCMSKSMPVWVESYNTELVDDRMHEDNVVPEYNFEDTNFIQEFKGDGAAIGIPTLLEELQKLCQEKIERTKDELELPYIPENEKRKARKEMAHYLSVLNSSRGWVVDDLDVCQDN